MKTRRKILLLALCTVLLVVGSVMGTMAYLTDSETVTNTFTVGSVTITLDETDVDTAGVKDGETRVKANEYKLMPGHSYIKDPIVHFAAKSEASWLFVMVENGISGAESQSNDYTNIATQISENGWSALNNVDNVYYKAVSANTGDTAVDYPVFAEFTVSDTLNGTGLADYEGKTIVVTAYAVQADGFETAAAAWSATFGKN